MAPTYPIELIRKFELRWQARSTAARVAAALQGSDPLHVRCPACRASASGGPAKYDDRDEAVVHHHWQCDVCGAEWITTVPRP